MKDEASQPGGLVHPSSTILHPFKVTRTQRQIEGHRQGEACLHVIDAAGRPCAGIAVWAEQETHAFVFGCVQPELSGVAETDRRRCADRLAEMFHELRPADAAPDPGVTRIDVPDGVHVGQFSRELDRLASAGLPLEVYVSGRFAGIGSLPERDAADRVAALYTICFAHPSVRAIIWSGFRDGESGVDGGGLLRTDFAPKPAFRFLHKLIASVWHSRAVGVTDADGRFRFRGFFGDYRVGVRTGEVTTTEPLLHRRGAGPTVLQVRQD
jgi:hypothetical protein